MLAASWHSNVDLDSSEAVNQTLQAMGLPKTLTMGKLQQAAQFRYWADVVPDNPALFLSLAFFRESFGVAAVVDSGSGEKIIDGAAVFEPGFLHGFRV